MTNADRTIRAEKPNPASQPPLLDLFCCGLWFRCILLMGMPASGRETEWIFESPSKRY